MVRGRRKMLKKINFPAIIPDNELAYIRYLEGVISSIDEYADVQITKLFQGVSIRVAPSSPILFNNLMQSLQDMHNSIGIRVDFSKSMKAGGNIFFIINDKNQDGKSNTNTASQITDVRSR